MGNTIINIRFGSYHFQVIRLGDWYSTINNYRSPITFRHNAYHDGERHNDPEWKWFQIYR